LAHEAGGVKHSAPIQRRTRPIRKTPLRRSPLKRKYPIDAETQRNLRELNAHLKRRKSRPKMTPARRNAKGQPCTLRLPGCYPGPDNEQVVLCHLRMFSGGGMRQKPHDSEAVFGCMHCHDILDGRDWLDTPVPVGYASIWECIAWALVRTLRLQREAGVLVMKGES
jgi:hypothetical protein